MESKRINVAVTGGTGFFGHNLIIALLKDTRVGNIHLYSRNGFPELTKNEPILKDERIKHFEGGDIGYYSDNKECNNGDACDICEANPIRRCFKGCQVVFHLAGDTSWWSERREAQVRTNINGTAAAYRAARGVGTVKLFIHTSTVDVMGPTPSPNQCRRLLHEEPYGYRGMGYWYANTKREAEFELELIHDKKDDIHLHIIRPCSLIGPWDVTRQYGRLFKEIQGGIAAIPRGSADFCHVNKAVNRYIEVAFGEDEDEKNKRNDIRVTTIGGMHLSYKELFQIMSRYNKGDNRGRVPWIISYFTPPVVPMFLLVLYAWFCELISNWITHRHPELNPGMARYMSTDAYYIDTDGIGENNVIEAVEESYKWYDKRGLL